MPHKDKQETHVHTVFRNQLLYQAPLVAHQHTSLVVFFSAVNKETMHYCPSTHLTSSPPMSCTVNFVNYCSQTLKNAIKNNNKILQHIQLWGSYES